MSTLKGPRIELKMLLSTPENAAMVWDVLKENKSYIAEGGVYLMCSSAQDMEQHISSGHRLIDRGGFDYYIFCQGKCIGSLWGELNQEDGMTVMLTGWIDKNHSGKGYMQEALHLMEDSYFKENMIPLGGYVFAENKASLHMMKKMGYHIYNAEGDFFVQKKQTDWKKEKLPHRVVSMKERQTLVKGGFSHVYS